MLNRFSLSLVLSLLALDCSRSQERPEGTNRLIHESSPYLLLHARNPVDWYPWGEEAIELARELDKPIFVSIGYTTCYWCHVMEEKVFSNPEIAALMNDGFVNIKVDREERPDLDEIYMTATQLIQRRGGWPNSVFLTHELEPFFAGTYFPPQDQQGMTGFPTILNRIQGLWKNDRAQLLQSAERVANAIGEMLASRQAPADIVPSPAGVARAVDSLQQTYDAEWGGFGQAPKFPSPSNLFLLYDQMMQGDADARRLLLGTLHHMGRGAIYDHVGGGFHRYATDRLWRVPHFEKMLYDNALLAQIYVDAARATADEELARLARGTLDFTLSEMTGEEGGFYSALDAQTEGREGAYYVWSREELETVLSEPELQLLAPVFGFDRDPNFEENRYTVYLTAPLNERAAEANMSRQQLLQKMAPAIEKMQTARADREYPHIDDKILVDWNGMMIATMAQASGYFRDERYFEAAQKAARFLYTESRSSDGTLQHVWRNGASKIDAFLDDYAYLTRGFIALYRESGEREWLAGAEALTEEMEERLRDPDGGYFQAKAKPLVLFQSKGALDGAIPSGNAVAIEVLMDLGGLTNKAVYRDRAEAAMRAFGRDFESYPASSKMLARSIDRYHRELGAPAGSGDASSEAPATPLDELAASVVEATLSLADDGEDSDWRAFHVTLEIEQGWHVNANPASSEYLIPTEVRGEVRALRYPKGTSLKLAFSEDALTVYDGEQVLSGELASNASEIVLVYQPCDDSRCLSPVEKVLLVH